MSKFQLSLSINVLVVFGNEGGIIEQVMAEKIAVWGGKICG
jgi:hypothetical protein